MADMKREKATQRWDLPHEYERADTLLTSMPAKEVCRCGRQSADALHHAVLEKAAAHEPRLITEKGI